MTGLPDLNMPAFHAAAARLRAAGYTVVNPAEINSDPAADWHACMRADIKALCDCDAIALLSGFENSRGACLELTIARSLGMEVMHLCQPIEEGGIYSIIGPGGRRYIGQAKTFVRRWAEHRSALRHQRHHCASLQRAWNKYGEEAFEFVRMFVVPYGTERNAIEQRWLDILGRGALYNSALDVRAPQLGRKHSAETRAKMSAAHLGKQGQPMTEAQRRKLSEVKIAKNLKGERNKLFGVPKGLEHRRKLSESLTGKLVGAKNPVARPVVCVETGTQFATYTAAASWLRTVGHPKADLSAVRKAAIGVARTAYGYRWARSIEMVDAEATLDVHAVEELA